MTNRTSVVKRAAERILPGAICSSGTISFAIALADYQTYRN